MMTYARITPAAGSYDGPFQFGVEFNEKFAKVPDTRLVVSVFDEVRGSLAFSSSESWPSGQKLDLPSGEYRVRVDVLSGRAGEMSVLLDRVESTFTIYNAADDLSSRASHLSISAVSDKKHAAVPPSYHAPSAPQEEVSRGQSNIVSKNTSKAPSVVGDEAPERNSVSNSARQSEPRAYQPSNGSAHNSPARSNVAPSVSAQSVHSVRDEPSVHSVSPSTIRRSESRGEQQERASPAADHGYHVGVPPESTPEVRTVVSSRTSSVASSAQPIHPVRQNTAELRPEVENEWSAVAAAKRLLTPQARNSARPVAQQEESQPAPQPAAYSPQITAYSHQTSVHPTPAQSTRQSAQPTAAQSVRQSAQPTPSQSARESTQEPLRPSPQSHFTSAQPTPGQSARKAPGQEAPYLTAYSHQTSVHNTPAQSVRQSSQEPLSNGQPSHVTSVQPTPGQSARKAPGQEAPYLTAYSHQTSVHNTPAQSVRQSSQEPLSNGQPSHVASTQPTPGQSARKAPGQEAPYLTAYSHQTSVHNTPAQSVRQSSQEPLSHGQPSHVASTQPTPGQSARRVPGQEAPYLTAYSHQTSVHNTPAQSVHQSHSHSPQSNRGAADEEPQNGASVNVSQRTIPTSTHHRNEDMVDTPPRRSDSPDQYVSKPLYASTHQSATSIRQPPSHDGDEPEQIEMDSKSMHSHQSRSESHRSPSQQQQQHQPQQQSAFSSPSLSQRNGTSKKTSRQTSIERSFNAAPYLTAHTSQSSIPAPLPDAPVVRASQTSHSRASEPAVLAASRTSSVAQPVEQQEEEERYEEDVPRSVTRSHHSIQQVMKSSSAPEGLLQSGLQSVSQSYWSSHGGYGRDIEEPEIVNGTDDVSELSSSRSSSPNGSADRSARSAHVPQSVRSSVPSARYEAERQQSIHLNDMLAGSLTSGPSSEPASPLPLLRTKARESNNALDEEDASPTPKQPPQYRDPVSPPRQASTTQSHSQSQSQKRRDSASPTGPAFAVDPPDVIDSNEPFSFALVLDQNAKPSHQTVFVNLLVQSANHSTGTREEPHVNVVPATIAQLPAAARGAHCEWATNPVIRVGSAGKKLSMVAPSRFSADVVRGIAISSHTVGLPGDQSTFCGIQFNVNNSDIARGSQLFVALRELDDESDDSDDEENDGEDDEFAQGHHASKRKDFAEAALRAEFRANSLPFLCCELTEEGETLLKVYRRSSVVAEHVISSTDKITYYFGVARTKIPFLAVLVNYRSLYRHSIKRSVPSDLRVTLIGSGALLPLQAAEGSIHSVNGGEAGGSPNRIGGSNPSISLPAHHAASSGGTVIAEILNVEWLSQQRKLIAFVDDVTAGIRANVETGSASGDAASQPIPGTITAWLSGSSPQSSATKTVTFI